MQILDFSLPMIEEVSAAGEAAKNESYISLPNESPKSLLGWLKRGNPPKIYRVRNEDHPRGLAERRELSVAIKDPNSDVTLNLEVGYRVACARGREQDLVRLLAAETSPGDVLDRLTEGWIVQFARDTPAFFRSAAPLADAMCQSVRNAARSSGLVITLFLERPIATYRSLSFSIPLSFRDQTEEVSVALRLAILSSPLDEALHRGRVNPAPSALDQELKRRIQTWFGGFVLRDALERQTSRVATDLKAHLDAWLQNFGLESRIEAIVAPTRAQPDVMYTVRVDGLVSLGHFQWQVRTAIEIASAEEFLRQKKERQINEIHIWLGEQYPEFCWNAVRQSAGDEHRFATEFEGAVRAAVESIGYRLKNLILRRILSEVELDARKQHLDTNLGQDKFLNQLIDNTQTKLLNAYDSDEDPELIDKLEERLKDLRSKKAAVINEIAVTRSDAKNLLPAATAAAIGAERRSWTAIADGSAEAQQNDDPKKRPSDTTGEDAAGAGQ